MPPDSLDRHEAEAIGWAVALRVRERSMPPDDAAAWARYLCEAMRPFRPPDTKGTDVRTVATLVLLLLTAASAAAQTPILPGQLVSFEVDPGTKQQSPTSPNVIARPEANVVFEYRIDGAAPIAAVKSAPCTLVSTSSAILTCRLVPPTLTAGSHTLEVRALPSPSEAGISPSGYSTSLAVAMIIISGPGTPSNVRVTAPTP